MDDSPRYHPNYCEENIWHLARERRDPSATSSNDYVVFISNAQRSVALWSQTAASQTGEPVVWDYHVILLDDAPETPLVWDLDSILNQPTPLPSWWRGTFPLEEVCPDHLQPEFRVVPSEKFLEEFSSNRSHMRQSTDEGGDPDWLAEPPDWEMIFDPAMGMTLPRFVSLREPFVGQVFSRESFKQRFDLKQAAG